MCTYSYLFLATLSTLGRRWLLTMLLVNTTRSLDTLPDPRVSFAFAHHLSSDTPLQRPPQMSDPEPYLLVEKCGASRGKPIYVITKHIPLVDTSSRNHACFTVVSPHQRH